MFKIACEEFCRVGRIPVKWDIKKHPVFEVGLEHTYTAAAGRKGRESHGLEEQKKGVRRKAGTMAAAKEEKEDELSAGAGLCGGVRTIRLCSGS